MTNTSRNLIPYLRSNGKYQLYNRSKNEFVSSMEYDEINLGYDGESYTVVQNNKYGIMDADGLQIIDCQYEFAEGFDKHGLAKVKINQKYGFINKSGELVIPAIYDAISHVIEGLASVKINEKFKVLNTVTNVIGQKEFDSAFIFWKGMGCVEANGKYGIIDKEENYIIPPMYDKIWDDKNNIFCVELNNSFFLVDALNKKISDNFDLLVMSNDDAFQVHINHNYGYIRNNGEVLIPLMYEDCTNFENNSAAVCLDGKWFLINQSNEVIHTLDKFGVSEVLARIEDGLLIAKTHEGWGIIDATSGAPISDFVYESCYGVNEGLCGVKIGQWGIMNNSGDLITDFRYFAIDNFQDGVACVEMKDEKFLKGKIKFYIDNKGFEYRDQ
jgi:hypothetical protein